MDAHGCAPHSDISIIYYIFILVKVSYTNSNKGGMFKIKVVSMTKI